MYAEQTGDFFHLVVAVDFDKAVIGVTFSHDGYPPLLLSVASPLRFVAVSSFNISLSLAVSGSQEPGALVGVKEQAAANSGRCKTFLLHPGADRVRAHPPEGCQFVEVHQSRYSGSGLHR